MDSLSRDSQEPVAPLLVELYDTHRLYQLAGDSRPAARFELCEIVSDILASSIRPSEHELIADILITIVRQAEHDLKQALAERLAAMDKAPLRLLLCLTEEDNDIASPILRDSPVLNDLDLMYIIQSQGPQSWRAIAARKKLSPPVVDSLAETQDIGTAEVLADNKNINLTPKAQEILLDLACTHEEVARPLLQRTDLPQDAVRRMYQHVSEELRRFIQNQFDITDDELRGSIEDVLQEFSQEPDPEFRPTSAMLKAASLFAERGQLNLTLMISTLKRGQIASFVAQFSRYSGLPVSMVMSMLQQTQGQGLAAACRYLDIPRDDFATMLLLTRRMVRRDGITSYHDLNRAIAYYDRISKPLAERILRGCRQS